MGRVLIVDDQPDFSAWLAAVAQRAGHEVTCILSLKQGLARCEEGDFDLVFLDVHFPEGNGLDYLPRFRRTPSSPEVVILTGKPEANAAEMAIRTGAWDYLAKSARKDEIALVILRALEYHEQRLAARAAPLFSRAEIVGTSPKLNRCLELAAHAARYDTNVLVTGESGTGKDLLARAIHENSARRNHQFIVVDCAALPENLVESMLFGHEKGAFTGADQRADGLIMQADGGTLSLEEVGDLPSEAQRKFLRVIQEHAFRRVGGREELTSDFRLIATTNRDLDRMVEEGTFRRDLLHRLRTVQIQLPPLRERSPDIISLALHIVSRICERFRVEPISCSPELLASLVSYDWPGNVRELAHVIEQAVARCEGRTLFPAHLPTELRGALARSALEARQEEHEAIPMELALPSRTLREARQEAVASLEKQYLEALIAATGGDLHEICRISGLSRPRLYALLQKLGLSRTMES